MKWSDRWKGDEDDEEIRKCTVKGTVEQMKGDGRMEEGSLGLTMYIDEASNDERE